MKLKGATELAVGRNRDQKAGASGSQDAEMRMGPLSPARSGVAWGAQMTKNPVSGPSKSKSPKVLKTLSAGVAKLVDARDLKSLGKPYGFEPRRPHQQSEIIDKLATRRPRKWAGPKPVRSYNRSYH